MKCCEDCGERVYSDYCVNCHEEVFIAEQYDRSGEPVPDVILKKIAEFKPKATNHEQ